MRLTSPSWWVGKDVFVCVSVVHTNPNTKPGPDIFETTLGHVFRNVRFRAPDSPALSGRSAETHKTYRVSPKNQLRVDGASESLLVFKSRLETKLFPTAFS